MAKIMLSIRQGIHVSAAAFISILAIAMLLTYGSFFRLPCAAADGPASYWVSSSDGTSGDYFGRSVAVSGDTLLVGAYGSYSGGSGYIFVYDGVSWIEQAKLKPRDSTAEDGFGYSVHLDRDTAIIGAYNSEQATGAAYVYVRDGFGYWTLQARLAADGGKAGDRFGFDVAVSGDTAIVGTYRDGKSPGAYVFVRRGGNWSQQAVLAAEGSVGNPVAIDGDTALVGAYRDRQDAGSASVFVRRGQQWSQQAVLTAEGSEPGDWFGCDVSLSGDQAVIGACRRDDSAGAAYVFVRRGELWNQQARLDLTALQQPRIDAGGGVAEEFFGYSVSASQTAVLVGAYRHNQDTGAAYLFTKNGTGWSLSDEFTSDTALMPRDWFGYSVSVSGDVAAIGAPSRMDRGLVYVKPGVPLTATSAIPVSTSAADSITTTSAVLSGSLTTLGNADSVSVYFQYGPHTSFSNTVSNYVSKTNPQRLTAAGAFSAEVTGLRPGTVYHFRAGADAGAGGISYGPDMVFTTVALPQSDSLPPAGWTISEGGEVPQENPWLKTSLKIITIIFVIFGVIGAIASRHQDDRKRCAPPPRPDAGAIKRPDYDSAFRRMEKLVQQKNAGLISQDEYLAQKAEILKEIRLSEQKDGVNAS